MHLARDREGGRNGREEERGRLGREEGEEWRRFGKGEGGREGEAWERGGGRRRGDMGRGTTIRRKGGGEEGDRCSQARRDAASGGRFLHIPTDTLDEKWVRSGRGKAKYTEKCALLLAEAAAVVAWRGVAWRWRWWWWVCIKPGICYRPTVRSKSLAKTPMRPPPA